MENVDEYDGRGFAIAGLVLGIIGVITSCIPVFSLILGLLGAIFSVIGLKKANKVNARKKLVTAALVLSILATVFSVGFLAAYINRYGNNFFNLFNNFNNNENFYDQNQKFDDIDNNFDSLKMDDEDIDKLDKSMDDINNGPGPAPIE